MMTTEQFLAAVERHLASAAVKPSRFGMDVLGDPGFVFELRRGRQPTLAVVNKVLDAIAAKQAAA